MKKLPAKKLGYFKENVPVEIVGLHVEYGVYIDGNFKGIRYYDINKEARMYLLNKIIPKKFRNDFNVTLMFINHDTIVPHTDSNIEMVINLYIQTSEGTTHFWEPHKNYGTVKLANQTTGAIYYPDQLDHIYSFIAKNYEIWALDIKQVHSVTGSNDMRIAFCFQSRNLKYNDFIEGIKDNTKNI